MIRRKITPSCMTIGIKIHKKVYTINDHIQQNGVSCIECSSQYRSLQAADGGFQKLAYSVAPSSNVT